MSHIVVHPRILMVDNDKRAIEALTALLSKALPTPTSPTTSPTARKLCHCAERTETNTTSYCSTCRSRACKDQTSANVYASSTIARPFWP